MPLKRRECAQANVSSPSTVVTAQDRPPQPAPAPLSALPPWGRKALWLSAGGLVAELGLRQLHGGGSWLGLGALAGGWWWLARRQINQSVPRRPTTVESWSERCQSLVSQFDQLDPASPLQGQRASAIQELLTGAGREDLHLALVSSGPPAPQRLPAFQAALRGTRPLRLLVSAPLPSHSPDWRWSDPFATSDAVIFHLRPPLMAADLRWLEALPRPLPLWLLLETSAEQALDACLAEIRSQWPGADASQILPWDGQTPHLATSLAPLTEWLAREGRQLPRATAVRCLERLHGQWQADLERLRRGQWRQLRQRTQWLVAAGVLLTPAMGLDVLVLTVANGLMLKDMARLWNCPWTLEQSRAAATEVGKAALALGVLEWGTQACAAAFQLHGATWLVGGTLQALSAAYLTRVIGHAMADLMARSAGVSEPDLAAIKAEAPLLVARAAEAERLDWGAFLQEARIWLSQGERGQGLALPEGA